MRGFRITLLGEFTVRYDGEPLTTLSMPRAQALLAYLLLRSGVPYPRRQLAFLFWPDSPEHQARTNLRQVLHTLRRALPGGEHLLTQGQTLAWSPAVPCEIDVLDFAEALRSARAADAAGDGDAARTALLRAGECYGGDLLPGCYDDWLLAERERLRAEFTGVAERLVAAAEAADDLAEAVRWARRLQAHDPLHEPAYRLLMHLHGVRCGDRGAALRAYEQCVAVLARELGVEPSRETRDLRDRLLARDEPVPSPDMSGPDVLPNRPSARSEPPLIGRRAEWATLRAAWLDTRRAGVTRVVLISGEAGIGKTRLAEEFLAVAARDGCSVASSRAYAAEGALPFAPVVDWLRSAALRGRLARLDAVYATEIARLLPELSPADRFGSPPQEGWQRTRFFEALARAVTGGPQPVFLLLDDLQWCDPDTLEWLHYLLRSGLGGPILMVATVRTEDVPAASPVVAFFRDLRRSDLLTDIELGPLSSDETAQLALRAAGRPLAADLEAGLYRSTGGVPLLVVETVRAAAHGPEGARPVLAPRVHAVLDERLAALAPATSALAEIAAVVGRSFDVALLSEAAQSTEAETVAALEEMWQHRLLRERPDGYDFAHDLLRETAYARLSPIRRRMAHAGVAQALEHRHASDLGPVLAQLAAHHELAGQADRAIGSYRRAAAVAERTYATREVIRLVGRGLELLAGLPHTSARDERELALRATAGRALVTEHGYGAPEVHAMFHRARELCERLGRPVDPPILRALAIAALTSGDLRAAEGLGRQLLGRAGSAGDPMLLSEARYVLGVTAFWQGRFDTARVELERAIAAYDPAHGPEHLAQYAQDVGAVCVVRLAFTLWFLGHPAQARDRAAEALVRAERLGHPFTLAYVRTFCAWLTTELGEVDAVRAHAAGVAAQGREHGLGLLEPMSRVLLGWARTVDGDPAGGIELLEGAVRDYTASGQPLYLPYVLGLLARSRLLAGDHAGAGQALDVAGEVAERTGERFWDAELHRIRGDVLCAAGNAVAGGTAYRAAVQTADEQQAPALELRAARSLERWAREHGSAS